MARITKAVLEQQVAASQARIEQLQAALAEEQRNFEHAHAALMEVSAARDALALDNASLRDEIGALRAEIEAHRTPSRRVAAHMPAWQAERAASMALAREMAMRTGRVVKA